MGEASTSRVITPILVGRTSQLATLHSLVEQAKQGEGRVVLFSGEAGIGKSRLKGEVQAYAAKQEFMLLQGNCFPADLTCPYAPLLDLLRSLAASNPDAKFAAHLEALAGDIFPLLPELVADRSIRPSLLEPEQEKRRIFAVLTKFFIDLSLSSPLFISIEDVHWSDDTSLDFLHYFARHATSHAIVLLVTYRHDEMRPGLRSWLTQFDRERLAQEIQLLPLSRNEVDTMLSAIFEEQHTAIEMRRFLHGELLDVLYALTEGNPFFVEEIIGSLKAAGDIYYVQGYWNRRPGREISIPRSVQDAVQGRMAGLNEGARQVLTLAAVAGRHFDFALLQQLTGHDEQQLVSIMKELVSAQLIVEESAEGFAFRHALIRRAIYTQLLARERNRLHRAIAEMLEQQPLVAPDMHLEELAYHFYQAGIWQKVADYALCAGEKALRLYSHRAAIDYFTWALRANEHLGKPPAPLLYRTRGQAYETLGEFELAQRDYTLALAAAHAAQDRIAEWQSAIDLGFLWTGRDYAQAETWFRQALTIAQELGNPILQAHSLNRIGNWHLNKEQPHEALHYHRQALTIFEQLQDAKGIAETLDLLGMASYLGGDLLQGTVYYQQAIALFRTLEDQQGLTSSLATLTLRSPTFQTDALIPAASLSEALQDARLALKIAREIGRRSDEAYALLQIGLCQGSQGEYGQAFEVMRQSLQIAEEIEHLQWQTASHSILGGIYRGMLAYPQARKHFEQTLVLARESGSLFWMRVATGYLASLAVEQQDLARAETLLATALGPDTPAETMAQRLIWCACVELTLAQGHPARALEMIDRLIASTARSAQGQSSLRVLKLRGEAEAALQRPAEAEAALTAAQTLAVALGARPRQWHVHLALGRLYQAQERKAEAEQAFASARTLIEELAATIPHEALRDNFLRQAKVRLPQEHPTPSKEAARQAFGGLTAREREVAALIAQGKYNREIADTLVVSERTVETHVSNIMFKLGFTSRRQIASWAIEKGLAPHN